MVMVMMLRSIYTQIRSFSAIECLLLVFFSIYLRNCGAVFSCISFHFIQQTNWNGAHHECECNVWSINWWNLYIWACDRPIIIIIPLWHEMNANTNDILTIIAVPYPYTFFFLLHHPFVRVSFCPWPKLAKVTLHSPWSREFLLKQIFILYTSKIRLQLDMHRHH